MAAVLNYIIPSQRFETIRDAIGVIVAQELAKQKTLTNNTLFDAVTYVERFIPFSVEELPAINVILNDVKFSNADHLSQVGETTYYVDITTYKEDSASGRGDCLSAINLHKLLGVVRTILSAGEYRFLGLAQGIVTHKEITDIQIAVPNSNQDSLHVISGRITIKVKATETNANLAAIDLDEIFTNFTIDETNFGNKITIINS